MTDGAVVSLMPVLVTAIRKRRTFGAEEFFSPGLAWLDSSCWHRNDGRRACATQGSAASGIAVASKR
ncbi:hypothetical protein CN070_07560 [Sinorhizobium meliloti]|nr:hypothetical protein CN070_07560 [Sinorhizobium meliloti]